MQGMRISYTGCMGINRMEEPRHGQQENKHIKSVKRMNPGDSISQQFACNVLPFLIQTCLRHYPAGI